MVSDMLWRLVSIPSVMPGIIIPAIGTVLSEVRLFSLQPGSKPKDKTQTFNTNIKAGPLGLAFRL
jgi:hypothetical protein